MADWLSSVGCVPDLVLCSSAQRTKEILARFGLRKLEGDGSVVDTSGLVAGAIAIVGKGEKSVAQMVEMQQVTGREIALVRLSTGQQAYVLGETDRVRIPDGARPIAHTHPE